MRRGKVKVLFNSNPVEFKRCRPIEGEPKRNEECRTPVSGNVADSILLPALIVEKSGVVFTREAIAT